MVFQFTGKSEPEDMESPVTFLVSPLAGYIVDTVIPINRGLRRYRF